MPPQVGQKRAAGESSGSQGGRTKKTRFVEPSEDPVNFAEEVDSALETKNRKGRVKNEGYESDSSDDGEGVVLSRKNKADDDEDDDMFTMGDKDEKKDETPAKKKKANYLRLGDIEGQEFGGSGSDAESSGDDEPEDEDEVERRKKAGMGYELSSFNMREEMEEGKFTEDGSYVRSFDPHGVHDRWMEGVDEKEIKRARRRKRHMEKIQKERMKAEEQELEHSGGVPAMEMDLLSYLKRGETVLEALQRLGVQAKKSKQSTKSKATVNDAMHIDKKPSARSDIELITHLASNIMTLGDVDIYSKSYEELVRTVRSSGSVDASWEPPSADKKFEYKWNMPASGQTVQTFGPFGEEEMRSWYKASYFGAAGEKVKVREVGSEWKDWDDALS
ncbi:uncharacterized protein BT62DRAFT_890498 [Guyanagaster necrorhizus]|uniref:GYF domain-containing protein n=1 Tax=Guyanagaster necrorhizus TaxID=856835 RepID=A0A9P7VWC4_9AGAR|nr:uncharacterized protein BT62DRAFT_890498 [Guyanagaster necrorhizus MCA 3950]KAG7447910.1 hypothetical protein BT62DRAFT_890498 [Guyanagaster necrorhizus MCA 3950]